MNAIAIIVAAGSGQRAGGIEKQFEPLGGRPVIKWSAETFARHPKIASVVIARPRGERPDLDWLDGIADVVVEGGSSRTQSVLAGLSAVDAEPNTPVLIHDAARPGLTSDIIDALLTELETSTAVAPALPVTDALKRRSETLTLTTVNRTDLYRVQTPQAFRKGDILGALQEHSDLVDDLAAIELGGGSISLIAGDERLHKITYAADIRKLEQTLFPMNQDIFPHRMGTGFDVHKFGSGSFVTLCGIEIEHSEGMLGHSDADVAWHALTDAILGALALGDIGDHFPPSDPQWKGAPSRIFLEHAAKLAQDNGYLISNVDMTIICEAPKIKPHRETMRQSTAELLELNLNRVSLKATTTEGLGFTGRREGIAAQAAVLLSRV